MNRQVSRQTAIGSTPYYKVYDSWDLLGDYLSGSTSATNAYLSGTGGLVKNLVTSRYYYQDASGSTSHLASNTGALLEWYWYDVQGKPLFYNASGTQITASAYSVRHLFTGQQWHDEIDLYDLRNRFYSPDIGRFLQADPTGFEGDPSNLYRYSGNDPVNRTDPSGLGSEHKPPSHPYVPKKKEDGGDNPFSAAGFPMGQGISTLGSWRGGRGGNSFYAGSGGLSMGFTGRDGGGSAPAGLNPDGTPILRALPLNNTIAVLGAGSIFGWRTTGNTALLAMMRGVGSVIFRDYLNLTLQSLSSSGAESATLVGYSRGGVVAVNEAGRFSGMSFNVIGIDAVTVGLPGRAINLPSNVTGASNYYQQNPHSYFGGNPFIGSPMTSSTIDVQNVNMTGGQYSDINHNNIVGEVHYRFYPGD